MPYFFYHSSIHHTDHYYIDSDDTVCTHSTIALAVPVRMAHIGLDNAGVILANIPIVILYFVPFILEKTHISLGDDTGSNMLRLH